MSKSVPLFRQPVVVSRLLSFRISHRCSCCCLFPTLFFAFFGIYIHLLHIVCWLRSHWVLKYLLCIFNSLCVSFAFPLLHFDEITVMGTGKRGKAHTHNIIWQYELRLLYTICQASLCRRCIFSGVLILLKTGMIFFSRSLLPFLLNWMYWINISGMRRKKHTRVEQIERFTQKSNKRNGKAKLE